MDLRDDPEFFYQGDDLPDLNDPILRIDGYTLIDDKLASIAAAAATPPPWLEAWRYSTRGRTSALSRPEDEAGPEERLAVWQAVRDAGDLPGYASFYLVADGIRDLTMIGVRQFLEAVDHHVDEVLGGHGLGAWRSHEERAGANYQEYPERCPEDWDRRYVAALTAHGEEELSRLYLTDREEFRERMQTGKAFFQPRQSEPPPVEPPPGVEPPPWADEFCGELAIARLVEGIDTTRIPLVLVWYRHNGLWEVVVALPPVEWVGGPADGRVEWMPSRINLRRLRRVFDRVREFLWDRMPECEC